MAAGRVGRAHGLDGSFYLTHVSEPLEVGSEVVVGGRSVRIERVAGTRERPILRLGGVEDRTAAEALRGEPLLVAAGELEDDEYLAADLVGCEIPGVGVVRRVIPAPSCDLIDVGEDAILIPFVSDAIVRVDTDARAIEVNMDFLDLEPRSRP